MSNREWDKELPDNDRREQLKLIYDYIKFHIGLYLASPAAVALIADAFGVKGTFSFKIGLAAMVSIYLFAGIHAGLFMSRHVNDPWTTSFLTDFASEAFSPTRRFMHHFLYWLGLAAGLLGLIIAKVFVAVRG